jgi:glutamyl-tRNA synthetase
MMIAAGLIDPDGIAARKNWYMSLLDLLRVRARTTDDIVRQAGPYFLDSIEYEPEAVAKNWKDRAAAAEILEATMTALEGVPEWTVESLETTLRSLAETKGLAAGKIFQPLRVALTGLGVSPGIFEVLIMQGRDLSLKRIAQAVRFLRKV